MSRTAARVRGGISARSADWYRFPLTAAQFVPVRLLSAWRCSNDLCDRVAAGEVAQDLCRAEQATGGNGPKF